MRRAAFTATHAVRPVCVPGRDTLHRRVHLAQLPAAQAILLLDVLKGYIQPELLATRSSARRVHPVGAARHKVIGTQSTSSRNGAAYLLRTDTRQKLTFARSSSSRSTQLYIRRPLLLPRRRATQWTARTSWATSSIPTPRRKVSYLQEVEHSWPTSSRRCVRPLITV